MALRDRVSGAIEFAAVGSGVQGNRNAMPELHSMEAEEAFVAGIMLDTPPAEVYALDESDFHFDHLRECYAASRSLHRRGEPVTFNTVCHELLARGTLDTVSWRGDVAEVFVIELCNRYMVDYRAMFITANARIIADLARRRRLMARAQEIAREAHGGAPLPFYGPRMAG